MWPAFSASAPGVPEFLLDIMGADTLLDWVRRKDQTACAH